MSSIIDNLAFSGPLESSQWKNLVEVADVKNEAEILEVGYVFGGGVDLLTILPRSDNHAIYVRRAYVKLAELMMNDLAMGRMCRIGLTGTPGVGKSVFLW